MSESNSADVTMTISVNSTLDNNSFYLLNIRKFFFMAFPKNDGKTLHIYTALVFSLNKSETGFEKQKIEYIQSNTSVELGIRFDGQTSSHFRDLTDSLIEQHEALKQIWDDIDDGNKPLEKRTIRFTRDNNSIDVIASKFLAEETENYYTISSNDGKCEDLISWVKTELQLPNMFIGKTLRIRVKFDVEVDKLSTYCQDYMWYICTPPDLNNDVSNGLISFDNGKSSKFNQINHLSKDTALKLNEWIENEDILSCSRARLRFQGQSDPLLGKKKDILVILKINKLFEEHSNRQFFTGLLIAFISSFVADYTRISEIRSWLYGPNTQFKIQILSFLFPMSVILSYITYVIPISRVADMIDTGYNRKVLFITKYIGIILSLSSPVFFHVICPIIKVTGICIPLLSENTMYWFSVIGALLTCVYSFYFTRKAHIKFYNYL